MIIIFSFTAILYIIKGVYIEQATGTLLAISIFMIIFILFALFYLYLVKRLYLFLIGGIFTNI
ncbi:hypothetical protein E0L03_11755 [Staphylococcus saprophyticus]|nr:hypothetical protein [Staphylococcus saprophyticus]